MSTPFKHTLLQRPCVKHFSHSHPLRPVTSKEEYEVICSGCETDLFGSGYKCTKSTCDFFLHKSCFELPRELQHLSHPHHSLTLVSSPPYDHDSKFTCNGCGDYGTGFTYHCLACRFDLHVGCAFLPKSIKHVDHVHPLSLYFSSLMEKGDTTFTCDACKKEVPHGYWIYYCPDCDYGTDLACTVPDQ